MYSKWSCRTLCFIRNYVCDQENKSFRLVFIRSLLDLVIRKLESISKRMTELNERLIRN